VSVVCVCAVFSWLHLKPVRQQTDVNNNKNNNNNNNLLYIKLYYYY
jgi:hypothetical protein